MSASNLHPDDKPRGPSTQGTTKPSQPPRWGLWIVMAAVLLIVVFVIRSNRENGGPTGAAIGKPIPQLDLVALQSGEAIQVDEAAPNGTVRLLHFWGTWCGPCRMEYPELAAAAVSLSQDPNFRFLPVSCESGSGETLEGLADKTNQYFAEENITSPKLADPRGITRRSAAERLEQPSLYYPTSMLIDGQGKIVRVWEGYSPAAVEEIASMSRDLLSN